MKPISTEYTDIDHFDRVRTWKDGKMPAWMEVAINKARSEGLCASVSDLTIARTTAYKAEFDALKDMYVPIEEAVNRCMTLAKELEV